MEQQFGERVAAIETAVASVKSQVQAIAETVSKLSDVIQKQNRPNWQVWIGVLGLCFALIGAGMVFVDMRIENRVVPLETNLLKTSIEIETQFNAEAQLHNVQFAEQQRLNALLWNSSSLGKITKFPEQPYFHPNISQKGGE